MSTAPDGRAHRLAFVTGTSSGIGRALATELVRRGWDVVGASRRPASVEHARYSHLVVDLGDIPSLVASIEGYFDTRLADQWDRVALVNNAASPDLLGRLELIDPVCLLEVYAVNTAAAVWLMGFFVRRTPPHAALRIVNVSSGAARLAFPGLGAYGSSKAALRMAGMVLASELASPAGRGDPRRDVTILSYEPGAVDTDMQATARAMSEADFPWVDMFRAFAAQGRLIRPEAPAAEIVRYLEGDGHDRFAERRFGTDHTADHRPREEPQ